MMKAIFATCALAVAGVAALALLAQAGEKPSSTGQRLPDPQVDLEAPERDGPATRGAVFAGGCFWCVEDVFEPLRGIENVVSGYAGGSAEDASYDRVSAGLTDHAEAVQITYDPSKITYGRLLQVFFNTHDPLTAKGQHPDYGRQYRPAVFYEDDDQKRVAEAYIRQLEAAKVFDQPIRTALEPLGEFYPAEEYHQDFARRNPDHPYVVRWSAPKTAKVRKLYPELLEDGDAEAGSTTQPAGDQPAAGASDDVSDAIGKIIKSEEEWRRELTAEQFRILRKEGTERAFTSPLNKVKEPGAFRCAGCDLPLFETETKFESGTGWPSFWSPLNEAHVTERTDRSLGMTRTEVECARCGGHLGHVFNDGPKPTGLRYCINGAALRFDPAEDE